MQLTQKWLNDTLAKNPALSIQVQGGKDCAKVSKPKEPKVTHPKYGNHKVYAYKDGFVAGNKDAKSMAISWMCLTLLKNIVGG